MGTKKLIGERIKEIRKLKEISVKDMSERTGISEQQINLIEENEEFPSLAPLIKIARVLGVRLGTFLDDHEARGPVICRRENMTGEGGIGFSGNTVSKHKSMLYHSLSRDKPGRHMEPFIIEVSPSEDKNYVPSTHEGEEFIYVLEGGIEIDYGKETYVLDAGDSIYYDSIVSHHVHALNGFKAKIIGVVYAPY
jgi:transcriptional regulator with XRE-family HTH domain